MGLLLTVISGFVLAMFAPCLHRLLGRGAVVLFVALPLAITLYLVSYVGSADAGEMASFRWRWLPQVGLSLAFSLDGLSLLFALLISAMGSLVCIYTHAYLQGHPQQGAFYAFILAFMASMLGLVLASNILAIYVFWELTTLSSFLLIGFDHERAKARAAAVQSLLVTALGGLSLLAGLVLLGLVGGSFELSELLARGEQIRADPRAPAVLVLIAVGAFAKSAQFPFHFWLPDAMEAPTPVSAYLHSATMVKAGVYLLARFLPIFGAMPLWGGLITTVGAVTMVLGALLALFEHDLKGILAYLTINVLGTLVMLIGIGTPLAIAGMVTYLLAHALYKGALFLVAGVVDHETHRRDIRYLRSLWRVMPATATIAALAALSMAGLIPFFGFVAKELFLEGIWETSGAQAWLVAVSVAASALLVAGAGLVGLRPFFFGGPTEPTQAHEASFGLLLSPGLLAICGVVAGLLPQQVVQPLLEPAASAVYGAPVAMHLALWHGVKPPLVLSLVALFSGGAIYVFRDRLVAMAPGWYWRLSGSGIYSGIVAALNATARWQTQVLQNGHLRSYVLTIVMVLVALLVPVLPVLDWHLPSQHWQGIRFYEAVAALLAITAAFVAVRSRSRFRAIAAMGIVGLSVAWIFDLYGAPDLAMTQLVIDLLTVLLFILAFFHLPKFTLVSERATRVRDLLVAGSAGATVSAVLLIVANVEHVTPISDYYAATSYPLAHGRNVVNVILVDFRALDTLGEATVLVTAALGVYTLLKLLPWTKQVEMRSIILGTATRYLLPLLVLYSLFLLLQGHHEPGGGFIGGLIAAAALSLCAIAFNAESARRLLWIAPHRLLGVGLLVIGVSGLVGMFYGAPFLTGIWWELQLTATAWHIGTPILFDIGIYLVVVGAVLMIVFALAER